MKTAQTSPDGTDPNPRSALSRERILAAAVQAADEEGLDSLSMRSLGKRLGVEAMSLYNYVAGKDELLDGMMDLIAAEIEVPADRPWREAMRGRALGARVTFSEHPWASRLMDSRTSSGPGRLRYFDAMIGALRGGGFSLPLAAKALSILDSYVYGFEIQKRNLASGGEVRAEDMARDLASSLPPGGFPHLAEMAALVAETGYDEEADFAFGLDLILDALERARA